jgi:lysophospholipase L1-like esterase
MNHNRLLTKMSILAFFVLLLVMGALLQPTPTATSTTKVPEEIKEWDYVVFGDSAAWGFPRYYASYMEKDLGVKVTIYNKTIDTQSVDSLLRVLRKDESLRKLVSEAEVITLFGNPDLSQGDTPESLEKYIEWEEQPSWYKDCKKLYRPPGDCSPETFESYIENIKGVIEEILSLRNGMPTIIRVMDYYMPLYSEWKNHGIEKECTCCWENFNNAVHQAAAAYNVPVARVYDAFNGPNHDEDPREKGYIMDDGKHTKEAGQKVIADLMRELGYDPVNPE